MPTAMTRHSPHEVTGTHPTGGLFLWVTLPEYLDATVLLKEALAAKVAYVPGTSFSPDGSGHNTLRLNFSFCNPEKINLGIRRLGEVFERAIEQHESEAQAKPVLHAAF